MTRSAPPPAPGSDDLGRAVVWSAGTRVARPDRRRGFPPPWRRLGLLLAATTAVLALGCAVHAYVVTSPAIAPAAPLWLPEPLPADVSPAATLTSAPPRGHRSGGPAPRVVAPPAAGPRPPTRTDHGSSSPTASGSPSASRRPTTGRGQASVGSAAGRGSTSRSDDRVRAGGQASSGHGADDRGSRRGSSGPGSGGGASHRGADDHGSDDHGSDDGVVRGGGSAQADGPGGGSKGGGSKGGRSTRDPHGSKGRDS